jgi:hypothetical protein
MPCLKRFRSSIAEELQSATYPIDLLLTEKQDRLSSHQRQALQTVRAALQRLGRVAEKTSPSVPIKLKKAVKSSYLLCRSLI